MRRVWIVLTVVSVALALALPAVAKKPVATEPARYEVMMTFDEDLSGLSTTCEGATSIEMFGSTSRGITSLWDTDTPAEAPLIHVRAFDVVWERDYPIYSTGIGFDECHGPSIYGDPDHPFADHGGTLSITIDDDAGTVDFLWHFDYYIDAEDLGVKKPRWVATVGENYTMSTTASYDPKNGKVHGWFPVSWYLREGRTLVHGYDPFEPTNGTEMWFYLEFTELS